ncbi:SAM-dependent methyltransferase [Spongiactinospora sp. TRM90649]|uniref:SAM-dependent methyltransferase n=1 Tax=Spongiactinospora sp. TRM90649 TaxID=3031114 RepID=UPI0023FA3A93|nr:SAM-dependent methyltransferase [Spongiactinospora sp. TRM90649]MDF5753265.1 SAM-dependent methyltransferase [Spongiactinospora sp. TRM90649]
MEEIEVPPGVDPSVPSVARMYDYYLGGKDNFASDRDAAAKIVEMMPNVRDVARENRAFLDRAVTLLAQEGIDQFLDIGAGLPTQRNVHQVAQDVIPGARVVYVDNDPIVLAHARALLVENEGVVAVAADMRSPWALLDHPDVRRHLDLSRPVGLLMLGVLHFVIDDEMATGIVRTLRDALVPGSYLAVSHAYLPELTEEQERRRAKIYSRTNSSATSRSAEQIGVFFEGFDLLEPGIVALQDWRSDGHVTMVAPGGAGALGGVGRLSER